MCVDATLPTHGREGGAAPLIPRTDRHSLMPSTRLAADVVVVGAGSSGLSAARRLQSLGHRVLVLEAHAARIGGRVHTTHVHGQQLELGAEFIHGAHACTRRLAADAGLELQPVVRMMMVQRLQAEAILATRAVYWLSQDWSATIFHQQIIRFRLVTAMVNSDSNQ